MESLGLNRCAICQNELAAQWKYCVHCGTPVAVHSTIADGSIPTALPESSPTADTADMIAASQAAQWDAQPHAIPSAIRPETASPQSGRRFDVRLAVGIAMAAVGILAVIYAVANLLAARG